MLNVVVLTGRLTKDPELKTTPSGVYVVSFSIAVERRYRSGEDRQADFINIVAWRKTAEFISKYFKKGQMIAVEGLLQSRRYQDRDGNNRTAVEVVANNAQFADYKRNDDTGSTEAVTADDTDFIEIEADQEDLPF